MSTLPARKSLLMVTFDHRYLIEPLMLRRNIIDSETASSDQ